MRLGVTHRAALLALPAPLAELVRLAVALGPDVLAALVGGLRHLAAGRYDEGRRELEEAARVRAFDELQRRKHG